MVDEAKEDCFVGGHCAVHGVEIERRQNDRGNIAELKLRLRDHELEMQKALRALENNHFVPIYNKLNSVAIKVFAIFLSLGLMAIVGSFGFYYMDRLDRRLAHTEEFLLNRIDYEVSVAKAEREDAVSQIITLLKSDSGQKEWQNGVIKQLELLNTHIRDIIDLKHINGVHEYEKSEM